MLWIAAVIMGALIILLNGILLFTFYKKRSLLKTFPNNLICNLAAADFAVGLLIAPIRIGAHFFQFYYPILGYLVTFGFFTWLFSLFVIILERDIALSCSSRHDRITKLLSKRNVILLCWITPFLLSLLFVSWRFMSPEKQKLAKELTAVGQWVLIVIFFVLITGMYLHMSIAVGRRCALKRHEQSYEELKHASSSTGIIFLLSVLIVLFLFACLPIIYLNYWPKEHNKHVVKMVDLITFSLFSFLLHPVIDPILVICVKEGIWQGVRQSLLHPCTAEDICTQEDGKKGKEIRFSEELQPLTGTKLDRE